MRNSAGMLCFRAPAKINLVLKVLDRLSNGYHALWSIMQTVELEDELEMQVHARSHGIVLNCPDANFLEGIGNLVYRAAELVLKRADIQVGLTLTLRKCIPMAAGLGGGSSDAAVTIHGLNQLLQLGWSREDMSRIGAELGSDVPFFFSAPTALVRGWGHEVIPKILTGSRWIFLMNPGFPIETKFAYDRLSATREVAPSLSQSLRSAEEAEVWTWDDMIPLMDNDFEAALFPIYPPLAQMKADLLNAGAEVALLSGSGATMFGIFGDERTALIAKARMLNASGTTGFVVKVSAHGLCADVNSAVS